MPILNDIMDHDVIGPAIRQGIEQGLRQGIEQGRAEALAQGRNELLRAKEDAMQAPHREAIVLLHRQISARFGSISVAHEEQLGELSLPELEDLAVRLLTVASISELFGQG